MRAPSRTRIAIVGEVARRFVNTPVVRDEDIVVRDIVPARHLAAVRGVGPTAFAATAKCPRQFTRV